MSKNDLIPKRIINSKGVPTTVWVKPDQGNVPSASPLRHVGVPSASFTQVELEASDGASSEHRHPDEIEKYIDQNDMTATRAELTQYMDAGYSWKRGERGDWNLTNDAGRSVASMKFDKRGNPGPLRISAIPGGPEAQNNPEYDTQFVPGVRGRNKPPTQRHRAVMGENMLGTVWAVNREGKYAYFDYDWAAAREYADLTPDRDVRIWKAKESRSAAPGNPGFSKGQRIVWATNGDL